MTPINWLHITDFHQGVSGQKQLWPTMRTIFFQDISRLQEKIGGPWDIVFFTGDLTQTGSPDEFKALEDNLSKLWEQFKRHGSEPTLLAVPGNHDLVRPPSKSPVVKAFVHAWNDSEVQTEFWKTEPTEYNQLVQKAFAPYSGWQKSSRFHEKKTSPGCLPGDFSFTFTKGNVNLGIVGLNSAFLQLTGGDHEEQLVLDPRQFQSACQGDSAEWLDNHDAAILLTHHPANWLNTEAQKAFSQDILARDNFILHLHGHMHIATSHSQRSGGSVPRRSIQGTSLFGLERYGEAKKVQRAHGYGAGRLDFDETTGVIHYWPRVATEKQGKYFKLGADPSADLDDSDKWSEPFDLRSKQNASTPRNTAQKHLPPSRHDYFLQMYRSRLGASYERWDLQAVGIAQSNGDSPVVADLFDMYLPLRLARAGTDARQDRGTTLSPAILIVASSPLVIRGPAGAGKTTWMRFTFRSLLKMDGVFPFMLVLRDLARRWSSFFWSCCTRPFSISLERNSFRS